jgi:hypothetical protein
MRCRIATACALVLTVFATLSAGSASTADKKDKKGQVTGTVRTIDKDKSTITVMKNNSPRQVVYNSDTKWMRGTQGSNKPSSLDELKENWYINCQGQYDGIKLVASACRFRESK